MASGRKVFYGWYVVAATILLLLVAAGVRSVPGIMLVPIMQDTGWERSSISLAVSLGLVKPGQSLEVPLDKLPPLQPNQLFEITLEPYNGSPINRPTGPILFIGRAVKII